MLKAAIYTKQKQMNYLLRPSDKWSAVSSPRPLVQHLWGQTCTVVSTNKDINEMDVLAGLPGFI